MNREEFFKKAGRYILLLFVAIIVFALGNKVVSASNCNSCPGNGICKGESDCGNFNTTKR